MWTRKAFYCAFVSILNFNGAAGILAPLTEVLKGKVSTLFWTLGMNQSFYPPNQVSLNSHVPNPVYPDHSAKISSL